MFLPILTAYVLAPSRIGVGTNWSGEEVQHFGSKEDEIDETNRLKVGFRVTGREDDMWVVEQRVTLLETKMGDDVMPSPPYKDPTISKDWLSPEGSLLNEEPFDRGTFELDRLLDVWLPDNVPDEWTADLSTTLRLAVSKGTAKFTAFGRQIGSSRGYKLAYTSKADGPSMTATGVYWFSVIDGRLLTAQIEAKDALLPGGTGRAPVKLNYRDSLAT